MKTFTQADLETILKERLDRQKVKYEQMLMEAKGGGDLQSPPHEDLLSNAEILPKSDPLENLGDDLEGEKTEEMAKKMNGEEEAFLNAVETISSNRELKGKKPFYYKNKMYDDINNEANYDVFLRGDITEDELKENNKFLTFMDKDNSPVLNTKDINAYIYMVFP